MFIIIKLTRLMVTFYFNGSVWWYNDLKRPLSTRLFLLKMGSTR